MHISYSNGTIICRGHFSEGCHGFFFPKKYIWKGEIELINQMWFVSPPLIFILFYFLFENDTIYTLFFFFFFDTISELKIWKHTGSLWTHSIMSVLFRSIWEINFVPCVSELSALHLQWNILSWYLSKHFLLHKGILQTEQ